jgi:DNA-binding NarL/FixJ family response regulator
MNMIIASQDKQVLQMIGHIGTEMELGVQVWNRSNDPLDLMTQVCTLKPSVLILDDDFFKPQSAHTLESIKKVNQYTDVIFITTDASIELGRAISQLGIHYYGIKPLDEQDLKDAVKSLKELKTQQQS